MPGAAGAVVVAALVRTVVARTVVARTVVARTVVSYGRAGVICAMMSAALVTQAARRSRMSARQPSDTAEVTGPGTAIRGRPRSLARRVVAMVPLRAAASTTTVPPVTAAISRFRARKRRRLGRWPGGYSLMTAPRAAMSASRPR